MKNILITFVAVSTFIVAQDTTYNVDPEPQLPGLGVYIGGTFGGATSVNDLPDGHTIGSRLNVPNVGISKGLFLGGIPLIVGAGYHPRGYTYEFTNSFTGTKVESETQIDMLDVWATLPYPINDRAILQAGFLLGTCLGGTQKIDDDEQDLEDIEGELDYGIILGGGYAITENIGINIGYYIGLAEFDEMMKFNGLVFNVGYTF